jgi:hypothetical protein
MAPESDRAKPLVSAFLCGYDERQKPRLAAAPFAGKLLKPFDLYQLCGEIASALANRA